MKNVTKRSWKIPTLIFLMLFCCVTASAQSFTAKGVVVDSNGVPVPGAGVQIQGNENVGAITDLDGNFSLTVPNENAILVFSFIGMETTSVQASKGNMRVVLADDALLLEETIVVGTDSRKRHPLSARSLRLQVRFSKEQPESAASVLPLPVTSRAL